MPKHRSSRARPQPSQQAAAFDRPALKPLVLALMTAMPMLAQAQSRVPVLPTVPANALPNPAAAWVLKGQGTWTVNGNAGVVDQATQRAIYQWQNYNIGKDASVTYQFNQAGSSALNRVVGGDPTQILGQLSSTVPGANGTRVTGGTVLLINPNGILFGAGAQVNTGGLIASTLNVDNDDYLSGFANSITGTVPTYFVDADGVALYTDDKSFVRVDTGAQITTASGGQVFLLAKHVENAGTISTPGGQTVLAAGSAVHLNDPGAEKLYASEVNSSVPALRGLLVEVAGEGRVLNTGTINTARGNTTLVGMAVNQSGRISATTSVTENGSVFLLARGGVGEPTDDGSVIHKRATTGGTLTLGAGSQVAITPETLVGADGLPLTIDGNTAFTRSRVELSGQTVVFENNAKVTAPGAVVNVRAEDTPFYLDFITTNVVSNTLASNAFTANSNTARVVLGEGAGIDVSGTQDTTVSVARNYVQTELIGGADLADAPLQRDGVLYRSKVTFDVRQAVNVLSESSVAGYKASIRKDASELLSGGGTVSLVSTGAVVTHAGSNVNVSGGQVTYTADTVAPTYLIGADGQRYTVNTAPKDITYTALENAAGKTTRWAVMPSYGPVRSHVEAGYVDGQAAGTVNILAKTVVLDGQLQANTISGTRQQAGTDALAALAALNLGRSVTNAASFGSAAFADSAVLDDIRIVAEPGVLSTDFWAAPTAVNEEGTSAAALPDESRIAARTLNASGFGQVNITSTGHIIIDKGADLTLPQQGSLALRASGEGGIQLGGSVHSVGGKVLAQTANLTTDQQAGDIVLGEDAVLDVAGNWVNRWQDGAQVRAAVAGGSVRLLSAHGLDLEGNTLIDVSGGGTVGTSGSVTGTSAGGIELESNRAVVSTNDTVAGMHLGAELRGYGLSQGGSLRIKAAGVDIVAADGSQLSQAPVQEGEAPATFTLSSDFFRQGGFASYDIEGADYLRVAEGTTLSPQAQNWIVGTAARTVATGTSPATWLSAGLLPEPQRKATNLTLSSTGLMLDGATPSGTLTLARTAAIVADAGAKVSLSANAVLDVQGDITAPGGAVTLALQGRGSSAGTASDTGFAGRFDVGSDARIDVSGVTLLDASTNGLRTGKVLDGGSILLSVSEDNNDGRQTRIDVADGAVLRADGAQGSLDVTTRTLRGTVVSRETVASAGGTITVAASDGGADLAGTLQARSASAQVAGGTLVIQQPSLIKSGLNQVVDEYRIDVVAPRDADADVALGQVRVAAQTINAGGFADVTLQSPHRVNFDGDVALNVGRSLAVKSLVVSASEGAQVQLTAPTSVSFESPAGSQAASYAAEGGTASLTAQAGMVRLLGDVAVQGIDQLALKADRLIQMESGTLGASGLRSQADVTLSAPQTVLATQTQYTIDAAGKTVTFTGGDANTTAPLSAGAALTVNAANIIQDGVLRVPLGTVTLNGTESVTLTGRSVTSVSGDGLVVPYGETTGGKTWTYLGTEQTALPGKAVNLLAPGQSVTVAQGAVLDLSGGGSVQAAEFVPGPGGSTDAFKGAANGAFAVVPLSTLNTGYAATDAHTASLVDANGKAVSTPIGQTITFGDGGPVPAGTYAVLPARYALLNGAFLVAPSGSSARVNLGYHATRTDGTVLVGAQLGSTGTALASVPTGFVVRTTEQAKQLSEMRLTEGDAYVAAAAQSAGTAVARLAQDAGALNIAANQLTLAGTNRFDLGDSGVKGQAARAGGVAIAADRIVVRDSADMATETNTLVLDVAQLNATGADTITLGALRGDMQATGRSLAVSAREVVLNNTAQALQAQDVVLAATEQVQLGSGAKVQAKAGTEPAETLLVQGDGALLRVSSDAIATTVRTDAQRATGVLDIGSGASVAGTSLTAEATAGTRIASDAVLQAQAYTLGAARVAVGDAAAIDAAGVGSDTLVISAALADRLSAALAMTLRSYDSIDFYGNTTLGGAAQQALTLDAGTLRAMSPGAQVQVQAGGLTLTNTSGATASASGGDASLSFNATGAAGGSGVLTLGPGSVATGGAASTALNAQRGVVLSGTTGLDAGGDLQVNTLSVTAHTGTQAKLAAQGLLQINAADNASNLAETTGGTGATLALTANQVVQAGTVRLASGQLSIDARGDGLTNEGDRTIELAEGSVTDLAGKTFTFDGQAVSTSGGVFKATAQQGAVVLADGSLLDVSAGGSGARAGSVTLSATQGSVATDGTLLATSQAGAGLGGTLTLDSRDALSLSQLAQTLDNSLAQAATGQENFGAAISVRNRSGNQTLDGDTTLKAQRLAISADSGRLDVQGTLDASGTQGGRIDLAAGQDAQVASGAVLRAAATGTHQAGGQVTVSSTAGRIGLASGATVDTRGTGTGANGKLALRAQRTSDGGVNDVAVDAINATLQGVRSVEVEAARSYTASTVNAALINTVQTDNTNFFGADNGAAMRERLAGGNAAVAQALSLRAGVEVQSAGNLTVSQAWNLSRFDADGNLANPGGAPVNLTLRAAGDLLVQAGLSSGFRPTTGALTSVLPSAMVVGAGGTIRLVAGADATAADVLQTVASDNAGDVIIGRSATDVLVRSTTGDLAIAAGRNVQLLNARAAVYTTGVAADAASLVDYQTPEGKIAPGYTIRQPDETLVFVNQPAMLQHGGSVTVNAARDVQGASDVNQYATEWWWRGEAGGVASWWSRHDKFAQGFGALGGGDVSLTAGNDIVTVGAAAPLVGYVAPLSSGLHTLASGSVSLQAGRDVRGGFVMAGGRQAQVAAGRDVTLSESGSSLQVLYSTTAVDVQALRTIHVGRVTDALTVPTISQNAGGDRNVYGDPVTGTANAATLRIVSSAGDVSYLGSGPKSETTDVNLVPVDTVIAAPAGDLTVGVGGLLAQAPANNSTLLLAAQGEVNLGELRVRGATEAQQTPGLSNAGVVSQHPFRGDGFAAQRGDVQPVRVISQTGNITVDGSVALATPLRMLAAGDITHNAGSLELQHTQATDLSLIQAGGDVTLTNDLGGSGSWTIHGPGDLVVAAEGNVNFNQSGGLLAQGNRLNTALPSQSANLTVLAGVHLQGGDYDVARQAVLELLSSADHAADLTAFVQARTGTAPASQAAALLAFTALPVEQQLLHLNRVLASELRAAGRAASTLSGAERDAAYERGYKALAALFPQGLSGGTVDMGASQIKTLQNSDITVHAPRGGLNVGQVTAGTKTADQLGIVTTAGGNITASVLNDIAVNRSRIFSVAQGDILLWASQGDIDAGRGAKTVTGAPPPVYRLVNGQIVVDTSGSYSGSGIAVLNEDSDLDLYAPKGDIDAGDAGIKSAGNAFFGAIRFVGADNLQVGGNVSGGPPPVQSAGATAGLSSVGQSATSAGNRVDTNDDEDERRKRRARRNLMLEFLGFGE